ncbi:DUF559 domain-containing protein [Deinococcus hopiensis]|uniref:DUF559 domain-containing protein n=1 Tax=Deinococcus hopiensis TaxID=309885 RepID=UPI001482FD25|nr:DUF559 domain-containing protein [Deinococcus hopiensis]
MATRNGTRGTQQARELRRPQTSEETMFWRVLRSRSHTVKVRRQRPVGLYIVGFVCHEARLAIELDGSQHAEEAVRAYDAIRT